LLDGASEFTAEQERLYHRFAEEGACLRNTAYFIALLSLISFVLGTILALVAVT